MKKMLFAVLLGLAVVSSIVNVSVPMSHAQDAPPEEPKPEKPGGE